MTDLGHILLLMDSEPLRRALVAGPRACYRVGVVTLDLGATVEVTWTGTNGISTTDIVSAANKHTLRRCDVREFSARAKGGGASIFFQLSPSARFSP